MRVANWHVPLHDYIESRRDQPFAWWVNDCCSFAAGAVKAITGDDPMATFPRYDSAARAQRLIKAQGGVSKFADQVLGARIDPRMAQTGDVVLIDGAPGETLAVCLGENCAGPGESAMVFFPMTLARAAWAVR